MEPTEPFQRQLVYIAGEAVSLMPTGLSKGDSAYVLFDDFYKPPGLSPSDTLILKNTFRELFSPGKRAVFDKDTGQELKQSIKGSFLPPCDDFQKKVVLQSLQYRFDLLRQKLNSLGIRSFQDLRRRIKEMEGSPSVGSVEGRDSMEVRQNLKHFQALKQLIEDYEKQQQCVNLDDKAFAALELDLTDDRVRELLRQFIFFTLQAHHPLEEYKKTSPTAPAFVKRLEMNPLGETFPTYLTTYQKNKLPIPETIARVLDAVNAEGGVLDKELQTRVKDAIDAEKTKILTQVLRLFPEGDPFWRTIGEEKDISRILDRILEYYKDASGEVSRLKAANAALDAKMKECEEMQRTLKKGLAQYIALLNYAREDRDKAIREKSTLEEQKRALEQTIRDYEGRLRTLTTDLERYAGEMEANQGRINQLLTTGEGLAEQVRTLQAEVDRLQQIEQTAQDNIRSLVNQHETKLGEERQRTEQEKQAKTAAEEQRDTATEELTNARADLAAKIALIEENTRQITSLQAQRRACENEKQTLQSSVAKKDEELVALRRDKTTLEGEMAALEEQIQEAAENASELKEETDRAISGLVSRTDELRAALDDVTARLKECEESKSALEARVDEPTQKLAAIQGQLASLESQLAAAAEEKTRLQGEITKLREEAATQATAFAATKGELDQKAREAATLKTRAESAEGEVASLSSAIEAEQAKRREQEEALAAQAGDHAQRIQDLTETLKGQLATQVGETQSEKVRADTAEALVGETKEEVVRKEEAVRILQEAIKELVTPGAPKEALSAVEDAETKETLALVLRKLEAASRSSSPSTAERRAENVMNQCYNVMLLTYLWQTNFPPGDAMSQQLVSMLTLLFSSGEYPGRKGLPFPGVYGKDNLQIQVYLTLLLKLLTLFSVDGDASSISVLTLTPEEITHLDKLSDTIGLLEKAEADAERARGEAEALAVSTSGEASLLLTKARENMLRLNPQLRDRIPYQYIQVKKDKKEAAAVIGTPSKLSFPIVFYSFMIVLRDHLNHQKSSLSRCPLPRILVKA
jgi:predicted nuclease with TOPRIM domain